MTDSDRKPPEGSQLPPTPRPPHRDDDDDLPRSSPWGPILIIGLLLMMLALVTWRPAIFGGVGPEVDYNF